MTEAKTYTEDELAAAINKAAADAVAPLETKIAELEGNEHQAALTRAVSEAKAEVQAQLDELQAKLDTATVELTAKAERVEALEAEKVAAEEAATQQAALDSRRDERLTKVKEAEVLSDEYVAEHADHFVAMSDEEFETSLETWKAVAAAAKSDDAIPSETALAGARETAAAKPPTGGVPAYKEVFDFRRQGIDPRSVRA